MLLILSQIFSLVVLVTGQFGDPLEDKRPGAFEDPIKKPSPGFGFGDPVKDKFAGAFGLSSTRSPEELCDIGNTCLENGGSLRLPILNPSRAFVLTERNCYCDDLCWIYNDCCRDLVESVIPGGSESSSGGIEGTRIEQSLPAEVFSCVYLDVQYRDPFIGPGVVITEDYKRLIHVVDDCPKSSTNEPLRKFCLRGRDRSADFFFKLPVYGRPLKVNGQTTSASILYRNFYCALCNGEKDVKYWLAEKQGCVGAGGNSIPDELDVKIQTSNCEIVLSYPPEMRPRSCRTIIESCAADWPSVDDVSQECRTYGSEFVYLINGTAYKNKHCARCNHIEEEDIRCHDITIRNENTGVFNLMPYSIMLDMNSRSGSLKNNRVGSSGMENITHEVTFVERCSNDNQIYDPFSDLCRDVYCSGGFELTDSGCQPRPTNYSGSNNQVERGFEDVDGQAKCRSGMIVRLDPAEYIIYPNRSVYALSYKTLYAFNEYSLVGTVLHVCAPFIGGATYNVTRNVTNEALMFEYDNIQSILSFVGVIISLVCLLCQFIVYMVFPVLRNIPGKCVVCLVVSLFVGQLLFLFVPPRSWWEALCFSSAAGMHYAFLAAFFWMNVMAFDICQTFSSEVVRSMSGPSTRKRFIFYSLYAWITPAIIVGISVSLDFILIPSESDATDLDENSRTGSNWAPHYGQGLCWFSSRTALIAFFAIPIGAILLINIALFIASVCYINKAAKASQPASKSDSKGLLFLYVKLSFVMGLAWIFGFIAALGNIPALWYVFILFNSLQGAFICLAFVCTSRVLQLMRGGASGNSQGKTMTQTTAHRNATNSNVLVHNVNTSTTALSKSSVSTPNVVKLFGNNRAGKKNDGYSGTSPKLTRYMDDNKVIARETAM